jgi:hypothetical protein
VRVVRTSLCVLALCGLLIPAGCRALAALGILMSPPQMQKPELELTSGRLAIMMDYARGAEANPVFDLNLHNRIVELLREQKVPSQIVPYEEVVQLPLANPDFASWSIQKVGRALAAEQVLLVRIDQLRLRAAERDPVIAPHVDLHLKVVSVQEATTRARLWPDKDAEPDGRAVSCERQPREADSVELVDTETAKLARETGYYVARFFYKYDLEERPPREP